MRENFETFRERVMRDVTLQHRLDSTIFPDVFAAEIEAAAAAEDVAPARLRPASRRATGHSGLSSVWAPEGWLPVRLCEQEAGAVVDWARFGDAPLDASFFEDSATGAMARPFNRLFRHLTPLDDFVANARVEEGAAIRGFMFHMSRCGSTLAAQMFAALPNIISLSEPGPLDAAVRIALRGDRPLEWRIAMLRAMVAALARRRGAATQCVVKLDSWHILVLPLFRQAFPEVPWVYLFRDPVEVLVSHMRMRGYQTVPDLMPPGLYALDGVSPATPELLCARILAQFHEAALPALEAGEGMAIDYAALPQAVTERIAPHFRIDLSAAELDVLDQAAQCDAKAPEQAFASDGASKRAEASDAIRSAAGELAESHLRLSVLAAYAAADGG